MWLDELNSLNTTQRADFRRIANGLLSRTYLLRNIYDDQEKMIIAYETELKKLPLFFMAASSVRSAERFSKSCAKRPGRIEGFCTGAILI